MDWIDVARNKGQVAYICELDNVMSGSLKCGECLD